MIRGIDRAESTGAPALLQRCAAAGLPVPTGIVLAVHAGVADLSDAGPDLVLVREVTDEAVARGRSEEVRHLAVPRLAAFRRPHRAVDGVPLPPWAVRLARLLRAVRVVVPAPNADGLQVSWRDDGVRMWLDGLSPLARSDGHRTVAAGRPDKIT